ncbi:unnamed protein product [Darwinula stevensoni]|uniref:AB hydrolase-1 domain-containing protein n=1 Tax=Darwinula stevensoni TaxID=69355 RepID=A0A7R9A6S6_9CRUS|nr:unnamed protein product [Darwinula stevensoni]CAG0888830.1 unnamed protein product [Darwinula stevensoni]
MASWTFSNIVKDDSLTVIVGISLASAIAFSTYYLSFVAKVPNIHCGNKKLKSLLLSRVPCLSRRYWVTPWCIEPRLHTILSMPVFHTKEPISYEREILVLHDGGEVALDWKHKCLTHSKGDPILILLPGLTGDSQTFYVRKLVQAVSEAGWCCVVFQNRGLAGVRLKTPRTYCAANFEDFKEVLDHVVKKHPESPLAALGVSLGGLILGNYLCVAGENTPLTTAVIISAPWDVFISSESLQKPWMNRALNQHLAKALCNMYLRSCSSYDP